MTNFKGGKWQVAGSKWQHAESRFGMELHEYPRPADDTGIGIHWTTGYATAIGMRQIREFWMTEMKALGVKWVKIYNHDGALDFAELLLAEGFMPIVRIYRPTPNPSRLDVKDVVQIDTFLRIGVRYFEFNSEPDRDAEWKGGRMPANGIHLVVENTIANLEIILERGGMPAIPAVSNGSRWDLVGKIVAFGRKDLFAGPIWQAIHNYTRNRPLDYPYDIGNQEGAAYTYRFYQTINNEQWQENAWRNRSIDDINRLRRDRCNPGATVMDEAECWLAYEYFDALNQKHLGQSIPVLSTECGYLVGEDIDPRYPATTPDLHMAQTLESCRIMMGTSQRFAPAPDYYFCTAFWLLGNAQLGSTSNWWETHAWYSERWQGGALPIVFALKAEPKVARRWAGEIAQDRITLHGTVTYADRHRTIQLCKNQKEVASTVIASNNHYQFTDLIPGEYTIIIPGTGIEQPIELTVGQQELVLDFDLTPTTSPVSKSRIEGTVRGGAGSMLILVQSGTGEEWVAMAREDGTFRFVDLPAGEYSLRVDPAGSHVEQMVLDGINQRTVELALAGWGYTIRAVAPSLQQQAKLNSVYCVVDGHRGLPVRVHAGDWSSEPVYTGTAPEVGEFGCELTDLEAGHYIVAVDGVPDNNGRYIQLEAHLQVDKQKTLLVEFVHTEMMTTQALNSSRIDGRVIGGALYDAQQPPSAKQGRGQIAFLLDSLGQRQEQSVADDGTFTFANLAAGLYSVAILGHEDDTLQSDLALDGLNSMAIELRMPSAEHTVPDKSNSAQSTIRGNAPNATGKLARLVDTVGNEYQQYINIDQQFCFTELAAGTYTLVIESGYVESNLTVDGKNGLEILFAELLPSWEAEVSNAGSMPGYSLVRVEVEGMRDLPVRIWKEDWEGMVRNTGSKPEYGPHVLEFSPLGPGHYFIEPEGLGLLSEVELTGLEAVWMHFRKRTVPLGTNQVQELPDQIDQSTAQEIRQETFLPPNEPLTVQATRAMTLENGRVNESSPSVPSKSTHYLFIYTLPQDVDDLISLLQYVAQGQLQIGRDRWAAFDAERVTIVAADRESLELREFVRALESADVQVQVLEEDFAEQLVDSITSHQSTATSP